MRCAIELKLSVFHRSVLALVDIAQRDPVALMPSHRKSHAVSAPVGWQPGALTRVAKVAEIFEFFF